MSLPAVIEKALAEVEDGRQKVEGWIGEAKIAEELMATFGTPERVMTLSIGWEALSIRGVLLKMEVRSIGDVMPVLRAARILTGKPIGTGVDYAEIGRRYWRFGDLVVMAFFGYPEAQREGATCRFVKVGEKTEPVFKLMCEGAEVEAVADEAPVAVPVPVEAGTPS